MLFRTPNRRTYAHAWIRDGALTSAALLSMGYTEEVRQFLQWYAGYQAADGSIPCCCLLYTSRCV